MFSVEEAEIAELEEIFLNISDKKLLKITEESFNELLKGIINADTCRGLFQAFDETADGLIDFKEFVCGLSALCKGPENARLKFMTHIWDFDKNGCIKDKAIQLMYKQLNVVSLF